jgi:hypothetical protein
MSDAKPATVPPTTLTPGGLQSPAIQGTTMKLRRRRWPLLVAAAGLLALVAASAALLRQGSPPPQAKTTSTQTPAVQPPVPRPTPPTPKPVTVRIRLESTPQGARVVRVADSVVLGITPETIELRSSAAPLSLRFEKEGYLPAVRETAPVEDASVSVVLEAEPSKTAPRGKKAPRARPSYTPDDEPAKL